MRRLQAITWILTVCTDLRLSQTKTLAQLVAARRWVALCATRSELV